MQRRRKGSRTTSDPTALKLQKQLDELGESVDHISVSYRRGGTLTVGLKSNRTGERTLRLCLHATGDSRQTTGRITDTSKILRTLIAFKRAGYLTNDFRFFPAPGFFFDHEESQVANSPPLPLVPSLPELAPPRRFRAMVAILTVCATAFIVAVWVRSAGRPAANWESATHLETSSVAAMTAPRTHRRVGAHQQREPLQWPAVVYSRGYSLDQRR